MDCRTVLLTILDQVDYTTGKCRPNEMVGAVLPKEIIGLARKAIAEDDKLIADGLEIAKQVYEEQQSIQGLVSDVMLCPTCELELSKDGICPRCFGRYPRNKGLVITCSFQANRGAVGVGRWKIHVQRGEEERVTYKRNLPDSDTLVTLAHWLLGDPGTPEPYDYDREIDLKDDMEGP